MDQYGYPVQQNYAVGQQPHMVYGSNVEQPTFQPMAANPQTDQYGMVQPLSDYENLSKRERMHISCFGNPEVNQTTKDKMKHFIGISYKPVPAEAAGCKHKTMHDIYQMKQMVHCKGEIEFRKTHPEYQ